MPTSPAITPEDRKRVAEAVFPSLEWFEKASGIFTRVSWGSFQAFDPQYYPQQKDALTRAVAQRIEALLEPEKDYMPCPRRHYDPLFRHALATNDTNALEALLLGLIDHDN